MSAALAALAGCGGAEERGAPADLALPEGAEVVGDFVLQVRPRERAYFFERASRGPGLAAQSVDDVTIAQDGVEGSGPANTVELVTNSFDFGAACGDYPDSAWCANVTLRHFFPRSLSNVYLQVTAIRDENGNDLAGHGTLNSDPSALGLDASLGLFRYTAPAATTPGVLGQSPHNAGARDWVFADPDGAVTNITLRVVASLRYASYAMGASAQPFVDACAGGASTTQSSLSTTMPFPVTLYDVTSASLKAGERGVVTLGTTPLPSSGSSGTNVALPSTTAPKPAIFPFWDDLALKGASAKMCTKTLGAAPNRQFVVTWSAARFSFGADNPSSLNFSTILSEGSDRIDFVYGSMSSSNASRALGGTATVGVQDGTGKIATASYHQTAYGTGAAYSLIPSP